MNNDIANADKVTQLQRVIESGQHLVQADFPLLHNFSKGVYARSLLIPAGHLIVGHRHATEHLLIMSVGSVDITTDEGVQHLVGFNVINTLPGMKRAILAHEDTIMTTIHVTDETDIEAIGKQILIPDTAEGVSP